MHFNLFTFHNIRFLAERFRTIWHYRPFWRRGNDEEYYGEIFNASNGTLVIVELGETEDEIRRNMRQSVETYDPEQLYTEASDYVFWNVDRIIFL